MKHQIIDTILGDRHKFSLEKRILHVAIVSSILISILILVEGILYQFSAPIILTLVINTCIFILHFVYSKMNPQRTLQVWTYITINLLIVAIDWLFFGGIRGFSRPLMVSLAFIIPFIVRKKNLSKGILLFCGFYFFLMLATWFNIENLTWNGISTQLIWESLMETGILSGFLLLEASIIVNSFNLEKNKVIELNESLKTLNNEIDLRNKVLKQLDDSKNKFFKIIAHDLRGPIGTIRSINEALLSKYSKLDDKERQYFLLSVTETSRRTFTLLENLLSWAKAESGNIKVHKSPLKLKQVVSEVIELVRPSFEQKSVELKTDIGLGEINTDKNILLTILRNLLSNALKFTPEHKSVFIKTYQQKKASFIEIVDQGIGMSDETLAGLFKIDEVNSERGTNNERGSGLGLILCHQLSLKVGAKILVSTEINQGSSFKLIFPNQ